MHVATASLDGTWKYWKLEMKYAGQDPECILTVKPEEKYAYLIHLQACRLTAIPTIQTTLPRDRHQVHVYWPFPSFSYLLCPAQMTR